jgi:hypothetical protein
MGSPDRHEYDRDGGGRCLRRLRRERAESGDQHVRLVLNEHHGQRCQPLRMSLGGTIPERHVRSLAVAKLVQSLQQRLHQGLVLSRNQREETDPV